MVNKWFFLLPVALILVGITILLFPSSPPPPEAWVTQIYPNYTFEEGVNQIEVPLIPVGQRLSREAGGWVIAPNGARVRFDHDVPVILENIDGRRSPWIKPKDVGWFGVEPGNGMVRYYGEEGKFVKISIKRNFYN